MSSKHRHGLPRKKPGSSKKSEIDAELPELEPIEGELPTLEPLDDLPTLEADDRVVDDGPVKVTCEASDEAAFDTVLAVLVPAMDKQAVLEAVKAPLRRVVAASVARLRHQRVLVRFTGEAVIGSAVKGLVTEVMQAQRPLKAVVRRGFGDETVHEGSLPKVDVVVSEQGGTTKVEIATGQLEALDLPVALPPHLQQLAASARGKRFVLQFTGAAKPDAAVRELIGTTLQDAGAVRAAIGERVLFDRELADRVKVVVAGNEATVDIQPADDEATTLEALSMVLPPHVASFAGKVVRLQFARAARRGELDFCVEACRKANPSRIVVAGQGEPEVVWPPVLNLSAGSEVTLQVQANGRARADVLTAVAREVGEHAGACKGKSVVIDWPAGFQLDAPVEDVCVQKAVTVLQPKSLACTIGGAEREPFLPAALTQSSKDGLHTLRLDTDAGKPPELQRAVERRLPKMAKELRGQSVRVQVAGAGAASRTLLRSLCGAIEAAGAMRLEVDDHGAVDVLLPTMLTVSKSGPDGVSINTVVGGRDAAQQALALQRELEAANLPAKANVVLVGSAATEATTQALAAAVIARGAARVVLDGPAAVQVHPPLFSAAEKKGLNARVAVQPDARCDAAMLTRQVEREVPTMLAGLGGLATATVTVVWPAGDATKEPFTKLLAALVAKKAMKVMLDRGDGKASQVHPEVKAAPVPATASTAAPATAMPPKPARASSAPAAPPALPPKPAAAGAGSATEGPSLISLLGRRDESVPPMILLGIEAGTEDAHLAKVQAQLQEHLPRFRGRCVLLILRQGNVDVPVRSDNALVAMLRTLVPGTAAATLVFRGPDAQQRPHFQVLHSTLRALPVGSAFADPRQSR